MKVAFRESGLWTRISILSQGDLQQVEEESLSDWLKLSGSLPLEIVMMARTGDGLIDNSPSEILMQYLLAQAHRWCVSVGILPDVIGWKIIRLLPRMRQLKSLRIIRAGPKGEVTTDVVSYPFYNWHQSSLAVKTPPLTDLCFCF
jgi:hypothetical protein